jgi:hypothetical protein
MLQGKVQISVEAPFVAVGIGYGFIADAAAKDFGIPRLVAVPRGDVLETALDALDVQLRAAPLGGLTLASVLRNGFRINPRYAAQLLPDAGRKPPFSFATLGPVLPDDLFQALLPPPEQLQFLYALHDQGSGRAFQSEPVLSTAGLGAPDGNRPFRQFCHAGSTGGQHHPARRADAAATRAGRVALQPARLQGPRHAGHAHRPRARRAPRGASTRARLSPAMPTVAALVAARAKSEDAACPRCGQAIDSRHFDASGFQPLPERGARRCSRVSNSRRNTAACSSSSPNTPTSRRAMPRRSRRRGSNGCCGSIARCSNPYVQLEHIVNPWGFGSFQLAVRLPEGATVELVAKRALAAPVLAGVSKVGGRLCGRNCMTRASGPARGFLHGRAP